MSRVLAIVALCLVALLAAGSASSDARRESPCLPKGARTVAKGKFVRVYRGVARGSDLTACLYSTGKRRRLESREDAITASRPPAIDVAGRWVGYAYTDASDPNAFGDFVFITAINIRTGKERGVLAGDPDPDTDVGSVKITSRGSVAWVACPQTTARNSCARTGGRARVFTWDVADERPTVVASGTDIDPTSLALHGTSLSWRQGGTTRTARFR